VNCKETGNINITSFARGIGTVAKERRAEGDLTGRRRDQRGKEKKRGEGPQKGAFMHRDLDRTDAPVGLGSSEEVENIKIREEGARSRTES